MEGAEGLIDFETDLEGTILFSLAASRFNMVGLMLPAMDFPDMDLPALVVVSGSAYSSRMSSSGMSG